MKKIMQTNPWVKHNYQIAKFISKTRLVLVLLAPILGFPLTCSAQINFDNGFASLDLFYKVLFVLIFIFISAILVFVIGIFISSTIKKRQEARQEKLRVRYSQYLASVLAEEEDEDKNDLVNYDIGRKLVLSKKDLSNTFNRNVLLQEILELHKHLRGNDANKLRNLYLSLGFTDDSTTKLRSRKWNLIVQGIHELTQMNIREAAMEIFAHLNHQNETVRHEAQLAKIKLDKNDPLGFLDGYTASLSHWEQANIYAALANFDKDHIPDFTRWLYSENDSVIIFALKMISQFNQFDAYDHVAGLLDHQSFHVRMEAIQALTRIGDHEIAPKLISMYQSQPKFVRIQILKALANISSDKEISFFESQLQIEDFEINFQAAKAIVNITSKDEKQLNGIYENADERLKEIFNHVMDERI